MKTKIAVIFILLLSLLLLPACRAEEEPADVEQAEQAEQNSTAAAPSLRSRGWETQDVYVNGRLYQGYACAGSLLLEAADLTEGFPDLVWQATADSLQVSDGLGHQLQLPARVLADGDVPAEGDSALLTADGSGTVHEKWVDIRALTGLFLRTLYDEYYQTWYLSRALDTAAIPAGARVPVLMYHAVEDDCWGLEGLFMSPADMRAQLQFLTENGYDLLFFSDLTHLEDYDKPLILTFDDGYTDNCTQLFPLLQEFGAKATVFVITNNVDYNDNFMDRPQVRELAASGLVEIGSHTVSHGDLSAMSEAEQDRELADSQLAIARITGRIPYVLSYPAGGYDQTTLQVAPRYYDAAVKSRGDLWTVGDNFFEIDRFPVYRGVDLSTVQSFADSR